MKVAVMKKVIYVNISFDDLHPEKGWGLIDDYCIQSLINLRESFNNIKYTFFSTPHFESGLEKKYTFFLKRRLHIFWIRNKWTRFRKIAPINILEQPERCEYIKELSKEGFFEIAIHWYNHYNPYILPTWEFHWLSYSETERKVKKSLSLFSQSWIPFVNAFRPPAWGLNPQLKSILLQHNFNILSLDSKLTKIIVENIDWKEIINIPQNFSIEHSSIERETSSQLEKRNYFFIKGHMHESLENWIKPETINNLKRLLMFLENEYNIEYFSLNQLPSLLYSWKIKDADWI